MEGHAQTILWRLSRGRSTAHATVMPGEDRATVAWFVDGVMDRAENYDTLDLALARADDIRHALLTDGWKDADPGPRTGPDREP